MEPITIQRLGQGADLTSLARLWRMNELAETGSMRTLDEACALLRNSCIQGSTFWLASFFEQEAGYAVGRHYNQNYVSQWVYVMPTLQRRGIGGALKRAQIDFARSLGCVQIETTIWGENPASVQLQRTAGFTLTGSADGYTAVLPLR